MVKCKIILERISEVTISGILNFHHLLKARLIEHLAAKMLGASVISVQMLLMAWQVLD